MTARSPNTFVIGAGPVATALAGALRLAGVPVLGLWSRRPGAARAAASVAGVAAFSTPPDLLLEADVVLVAVRDAALGEVATTLVGTGLVTVRHTLLHCSGAFGAAEAFGPAAAKVGGIGTIHPLRAIADAKVAMRSLRGTIFGVEGDERGKARAQALVAALGGTALELDGRHMASYHAAAAIASNYAVALLDIAASVLAEAGVPAAQALSALVPLAQGALANVVGADGAAVGTAAALTGPIRRGDDVTVARHLQALAGDPELAEVYRVLGRRTAAIAARIAADAGGPSADGLARIRALLAEPAPVAAAVAPSATDRTART